MSPVYRGEIKIQGRSLRGWIANANDPAERVAFDLLIDGEEKGSYLADRPYLALERYTAFGDGAHGFALQLDRDWISGEQQNVTLAVKGAPSGVELHAPLGPRAKTYFDDGTRPAATKRTREESEASRELAECRKLRKSAETEEERAAHQARYFEILERLSKEEDRGGDWRHSILLAREYYDLGRYAEASRAADRVINSEKNNVRALMVKGRSLIALNHAEDAHKLFQHALKLQPENPGARFYARMAEALSLDAPPSVGLTAGVIQVDSEGNIGGANGASSLAERLAKLPFDWVRFSRDARGQEDADAAAVLNEPVLQRVGCAKLPSGIYWRRDALAGLANAGLLARLDDASRWEAAYMPGPRTAQQGRKVVLVTTEAQRGLMQELAATYAALGYEPVVWDAGGPAGQLRRIVLEQGAAFVHAVSGAGQVAADALAFTNVPLIYGVHSWSDMLGDSNGGDAFDKQSGAPRPRREFDAILIRATQLYAASPELRDVVEQCFNVRCPIFATASETSPQ